MASGFMDIYPNKSFTIWVSKFGNHQSKLPRNTVVGHAVDSPTGIFTPSLTPSQPALQPSDLVHQSKQREVMKCLEAL